MQAQQDPQRPGLPAYLSPPPYLSPPGMAAYGINGGTGSTGSFTQPGSAHSTPQYTALLPSSSPYQYPYPYQQYETAAGAGAAHHGLSVTAAQYGGAVGRTAELYGERSDGACSVSSSRPMSAISVGSAMADGLHSYVGHPALRLYSAGRTAVVRSASPAAAAAANGRNSPMPPAAAGSSAAQQQHTGTATTTTQQQQGALPPNPFLGSALRRPASATSRAGGAGGGGGGGAGHEGAPEWGPHQQQGAAAVAAGCAPGLARSGSTAGAGSGSAYPHGGYPGGSAALQQLQQLQAAAAALAAAQSVGSAPGAAAGTGAGGGYLQVGLSAGSAHNHVRAAHSSALEAAGAAGTWCVVRGLSGVGLIPSSLQSTAERNGGVRRVDGCPRRVHVVLGFVHGVHGHVLTLCHYLLTRSDPRGRVPTFVGLNPVSEQPAFSPSLIRS